MQQEERETKSPETRADRQYTERELQGLWCTILIPLVRHTHTRQAHNCNAEQGARAPPVPLYE